MLHPPWAERSRPVYDRRSAAREADHARDEAVRRFTVEDLAKQTEGVECRKDAGVLDEIPGAYKDLDLVTAAPRELVDVVHTLRTVMTVKG